jgi:murein DD-endopeptidase MepM/ murein hydrolase activator NlpD
MDSAAEIARHKLALERDRAAIADLRGTRQAELAARRSVIRRKKEFLARVLERQDRLRAVADELKGESERVYLLLSGLSSSTVQLSSHQGRLLWPVNGPVTSRFGPRSSPVTDAPEFHTGIDIAARYGAAVRAAASGTVVFVGQMSGYGNVVAIDHGGGLATTYNHLSAFSVTQGEKVARGTRVGAVGCTGFCTGPHLHFEVRINGRPVDPMPFLH